MASLNEKFSTLYKISMSLIVGETVMQIDNGSIVSIAIVNNYDTMTHPIIRVRLYPDLSVVRTIAADPSNVQMRANLDGGVYKISDNTSPVLVAPARGISFKQKVYFENKNIPSSYMDNYIDGEKRDSDLNTDIKVPFEFFCYNEQLIHYLKQRTESIYCNMSLQSVVDDIFTRNSITNCTVDPFDNQTKFDQILIPNLCITDALGFFENAYGLYRKGGLFYCDLDHPYLCNSDVNAATQSLPIYIYNAKSNDDSGGLRKIDNAYYMSTKAQNISVTSETDIERTINAKQTVSVNVNDMTVDVSSLENLYEPLNVDVSDISTPNILHKSVNTFLPSIRNARISEKITNIDLSGVGFDIAKLRVNSRYNVMFDSPLRGMKIASFYRATFACHVLTNMDADLFIANSTFNFRSN